MISSHILELTKEVDKTTFNRWRDKVKNKKKYNQDTDEHYALADDGIIVWYQKTEFKRKIKLIVNPMWEPNEKNIAKLLSKLDEYIGDYFDFKYKLKDFKLTFIDFTVDIDVGSHEKAIAYIKILHNIRKVKGFSPKPGKSDESHDENMSFKLAGNSNGIDFTACTRLKKANGFLRFKVKLTTQKAISSYTGEKDTVKRIIELSRKSKKIFLDTFVKIIPFGDFYKKNQAMKLIEDNIADKKLKRKMLRLLELIPQKKSLYLAQKEMNERNIDRIMEGFYMNNLSPVVISKRHKANFLENLYNFFLQ